MRVAGSKSERYDLAMIRFGLIEVLLLLGASCAAPVAGPAPDSSAAAHQASVLAGGTLRIDGDAGHGGLSIDALRALDDGFGPLRLVVPTDAAGSRSVRNLERLTIVDLRRIVPAR